MTRFIVMTANSPGPCNRKIAVVETNLPNGERPKMISDHAPGVVRIIETWERLSADRSTYARALHEAEVMVASLNAGDQPSLADPS